MKNVLGGFFEQSPETFSWSEAFAMAALLPLVFTIRSVSGFVGGLLMAACGFRYLQALRQEIFDKLQLLPFAYFDRQAKGDLLSRILVDTQEVSYGIIDVSTEVRQPIQMAAALGFIFYTCAKHNLWSFLLVLAVTFPAVIIPIRLIARHLRRRARNCLEVASEITQSISENLGALREIRAYNLQKLQGKRFGESLDRSFVESIKLFKYQKLNQPLTEILSACVVSAIFLASLQVGITLDVFIAIGTAFFFCFDPVKKITKAYNNFERMRPAFERINGILQEPLVARDPDAPKTISSPKGQVSFKEVTFSYQHEPVLRNFSFSVTPNSSLALIGPSGAGKSTIINLLLRFYDADQGEIMVDGVNVCDLTRKHLRDQFTLVSQSPFLFNCSIFENIALSKSDATQEEVEEAAKKAQAHDFITALEQGYDTYVGDDGGRLSGGQRQRIALARAFLKPAPIVLLDEATSALDAESEQAVREALKQLMSQRSIIAISHRLSFIEHFDRIGVVNDGRLVGLGSHSELYGQNPLYTMLYDQYHSQGKDRTDSGVSDNQ